MTRVLLRRPSALSRRAPISVRRSIAGPLPMLFSPEPRKPRVVLATGVLGALVLAELAVGLAVLA